MAASIWVVALAAAAAGSAAACDAHPSSSLASHAPSVAFVLPSLHARRPVCHSERGRFRRRPPMSRDADSPSLFSLRDGSDESHDDMYIQFSRVFQRHVVYRCHTHEVVRSYQFLDEAVHSHPNARVLAPRDLPFPPPSCSLVYPDDDGVADSNRLTVSRGRLIDTDVEEEECETTIAGMGLWTVCELEYDGATATAAAAFEETSTATPEDPHERAHAALRTLLQLVSSDSTYVVPRHFFRLDPRRFALRGLTPQSITLNHARVGTLLSRGHGGRSEEGIGLAMDPSDVAFVLQNFPQLCLYDCDELEELVQFLLRPLPPAGSLPSVAMVADRGAGGATVDWPSLLGKGYGAGLTVDQATKAMRMMPELLALYYEDSRKPSTMHLYSQMSVPVSPKLIDEATIKLNLEGTDGSDAYTFAYLRFLGISWGQLRILASALPLWTTCHLEPGWELLQKGPVRSMLKRPALDYLRQRLQIGPGDIYRLLKTHSRLSTYDACKKMMPTLDLLQGRLGLSSAELKKLVLRMPSLVGMGRSNFDERLAFFTHEAGVPIEDLRKAVMIQPSLLQYSVASTLRPKMRFFLDELGIPQSSLTRIILVAPASFGLSLNENLRPKLVSLMRLCQLDLHEVGQIISTSPQILLLSQKRKIEPTLNFLAHTLMLNEPRELGQVILSAPRILVQGLETSLAKKMELLISSNAEKSRAVAAAIVRKNPSTLALANTVLQDRIDRCPADKDIATWLLPTKKGRKRAYEQPASNHRGEPIIACLDGSAPQDSVTRIYQNANSAAKELGVSESAINTACRDRTPIGGNYLYDLRDITSTPQKKPSAEEGSGKRKLIPVRIFCSGGTYPSDRADLARGQTRTGGLAIQAFTDGSIHNKAQFFRDFSAAAKSCFGIRVPIGEDDDGSELVAIFPLMSPSRNRCELFACSGALRICEAFVQNKMNDNAIYDIKVYTDSPYAWKFVKSKDQLLELGSHATSREMLKHLRMGSHSANIDILHPLARSFNRLNGDAEPTVSTQQTIKNARVEFLHSMDGIGLNEEGLRYIKRLKLHARSAAMWQFNRERKVVS